MVTIALRKGKSMKSSGNEDAARMARRSWGSESALKKAAFKIHGKTKRQCIKEGLGAEWMAVWRHKRQFTRYRESPHAIDKGPRTVTKAELVSSICDHVFSRDDVSLAESVLLKLFEQLINEDEGDAAGECFRKMLETMKRNGMLDVFFGDHNTVRLLSQLTAKWERAGRPSGNRWY
jgi:hypothetical protein